MFSQTCSGTLCGVHKFPVNGQNIDNIVKIHAYISTRVWIKDMSIFCSRHIVDINLMQTDFEE